MDLTCDEHYMILSNIDSDCTIVWNSEEIVLPQYDSLFVPFASKKITIHALPGRNDTVRLGLEALLAERPDLAGCMFLPGDQPLLRRESVESLLRAFAEHLQTQKETERMIFRLAYRAKDDPTPLVGSPVLFDSGYFPALRALPEGKGGSFLLRQYPEQVHCFYTAHHEELWDADTPEALQKLEAML